MTYMPPAVAGQEQPLLARVIQSGLLANTYTDRLTLDERVADRLQKKGLEAFDEGNLTSDQQLALEAAVCTREVGRVQDALADMEGVGCEVSPYWAILNARLND